MSVRWRTDMVWFLREDDNVQKDVQQNLMNSGAMQIKRIASQINNFTEHISVERNRTASLVKKPAYQFS
ncbi:hypothetical protein ACO0LF_16870 [Undibacterium sp. Di27W]|uniref:hypothetical protein n=1 Tax=Undibacterium sp. Di27W TaxID=3413036 RepID=UPI003BF224C2